MRTVSSPAATRFASSALGSEADRIDARVEPLRPFAPNLAREPPGGAERHLGPELPCLVYVGIAYTRDGTGPAARGELDHQTADHSGGARDEHGVAVLDRRGVHEKPGGETAHRQRAPFRKPERVRRGGEDRCGHRDLFSERPDPHPGLRHEPDHATAVDGLTGEVPALHLRKLARAAGSNERAVGVGKVPRTERSRPHAHELLAIRRRRVRHF
jgi:hypothetical protein